LFQGTLAAAQGGNFWQAAGIGLVSSGIAHGLSEAGALTQALGGATTGAFASKVTGGSFVEGFATGLTVAGLNHALHSIVFKLKNPYYGKEPKYNESNPLHEHFDEAVTLEEWVRNNDGFNREEIINQRSDRSQSPLSSQKGGPRLRYVFNPQSGNIIDMRHMLIMGNNGPLIGNLVEVGQSLKGLKSGMNAQDFYSNKLGYRFYRGYYNNRGARFLRNSIYINIKKLFNEYSRI
jgi:hypothetical protein